ncbi:FMRFamide-related peptide-like, partial [Parasponia andersonii]
MHESRLRHHGIVVGGLVHPPSVRARKPARGLFSDYLHFGRRRHSVPLRFGRIRHMGVPP